MVSIDEHFRAKLKRVGRISFAAALLTIGLMTYGGWVRAAGAGLGCPDWPLCNGVVIPDLSQSTAIELGHRAYAGITMLVVGLACVLAYRIRHVAPITFRLLLGAFVVIIIQAVLGGVTVLSGLHSGAVLAHFLLAMLTLALLCASSFIALDFRIERGPGLWGPTLLLGLGFLLAVLGNSMVGAGHSAGCPGLPFCDDRTRALEPVLLHSAHRVAAAILMVSLIGMGAWLNHKKVGRLLIIFNHSVILGMLIQIVVGLFGVYYLFPEILKVVHVGIATVIWWALVSGWVLAFMARRPQ